MPRWEDCPSVHEEDEPAAEESGKLKKRKSAGSSIRRHNEAMLAMESRELLSSWLPTHLRQAALIWVSAPGPARWYAPPWYAFFVGGEPPGGSAGGGWRGTFPRPGGPYPPAGAA